MLSCLAWALMHRHDSLLSLICTQIMKELRLWHHTPQTDIVHIPLCEQ